MTQVSGLVVHLSGSQPERSILHQIESKAGFELGAAPDERSLPVVLEAQDAASSKREVQWLEGIAGVARVDVVFVTCSDTWDSSGNEFNPASRREANHAT